MEYLFFTTDTVATRKEAKSHGDLVLFSPKGMPREEWELVTEWRRATSSSSSSSSTSRDRTPTAPRASSRGASIYAARAAPLSGGASSTLGQHQSGLARSKSAEGAKKHPKLCKEDLKKWCGKVEKGDGRVETCLFDHRAQLKADCREDLAQ